MAMKRLERGYISRDFDALPDVSDEYFQHLVHEGWELVQLVPVPGESRWRAYFTRVDKINGVCFFED